MFMTTATTPSAPQTPRASTSAITAQKFEKKPPSPSSSAGDDDGSNSIQQPTSLSPPESSLSTLARVLAEPSPYTRSRAVDDTKNVKKRAIWAPQKIEDDPRISDVPSDGNDAEEDQISHKVMIKLRRQSKKAVSKRREISSDDLRGEAEPKLYPSKKGTVFRKLLGHVGQSAIFHLPFSQMGE
jgi:hypothetical protein